MTRVELLEFIPRHDYAPLILEFAPPALGGG